MIVLLSYASLVAWWAFVIYQINGAIQNIYYHPLSKFPGYRPWIAFPVLRYISQARGTFDQDLKRFHTRYGPVVRFSVNSMSFTTAQAWKDIYGYGHGQNQWPKLEFRPPGATSNILFSNDADHAKFRKALAHAFSEGSLRLQEDLIKGYVDQLIVGLRQRVEAGDDVDMMMWYNLTTFDIISDLAFGEPSNCLRNGKPPEYITTMMNFIRIVPLIQLMTFYPWIWRTISLVIGKSVNAKRQAMFQIGRDMLENRKADTSKDGRGDFMEALMKHSENKVHIPDKELESNAHILFLAGSETTATLLAGVTYYMLRTPEVYAKAAEEVRAAFTSEEDITFSSASVRIPYTLACLEEGLRMYPPVATVLLRTTSEPATISGHTIPAGTHVGVHQLSTNSSSVNFHLPHEFHPERWLSESITDEKSPFHNDNREARQPFSVGARNCIGKNLAFSEMRQILARVLWNFDLELVDKEADWADQKTYVVWAKGALNCVIREREEEE